VPDGTEGYRADDLRQARIERVAIGAREIGVDQPDCVEAACAASE